MASKTRYSEEKSAAIFWGLLFALGLAVGIPAYLAQKEHSQGPKPRAVKVIEESPRKHRRR